MTINTLAEFLGYEIPKVTIQDYVRRIINDSVPGDYHYIDKKYVQIFTSMLSELDKNDRFVSYTDINNKIVYIHLHTPRKYVKVNKKHTRVNKKLDVSDSLKLNDTDFADYLRREYLYS